MDTVIWDRGKIKTEMSFLSAALLPVPCKVEDMQLSSMDTQLKLQYVSTGLKGQLLSLTGFASMSVCFCWSLNVPACHNNEKKHTRVSKNQYDPGRNSQYFVKNPHNANTRVYVRCCSDLQDFSSYPVGLQKLPLHSFCMSNGILIQWVDSSIL